MYSATSPCDMLMCSEPTMSCICSSVGRLTVDMGPPNDVAAAGIAGAECRVGPLRAELRESFDDRVPFDAGRSPFDAERAGPLCDGAADGCGRGGIAIPLEAALVLRAPPRPTRSAMA